MAKSAKVRQNETQARAEIKQDRQERLLKAHIDKKAASKEYARAAKEVVWARGYGGLAYCVCFAGWGRAGVVHSSASAPASIAYM